MKQLIILFFILWLSAISHAQHVAGKSPLVIRVDDTIMQRMRTDPAPYNFYVTRNNKSQAVTLLFPAGATANSVTLYQTKDYEQYKYEQLPGLVIRSDDAFMKGLDAQLKLDLTSLVDGDYTALYSSCSYGGEMRIFLYTE